MYLMLSVQGPILGGGLCLGLRSAPGEWGSAFLVLPEAQYPSIYVSYYSRAAQGKGLYQLFCLGVQSLLHELMNGFSSL